MRGTVAKRIRKKVYGTDLSPKYRKLFIQKNGMIVADEKRMEYQNTKRDHLKT